MKKGNASLFGATLVITAAIVAGAYLLDRAEQSAASGSTKESGWTTLRPGSVSAETSPTGNDNIITCQHPEYGTVYSNAANCDEVDYDSRLSRAETFEAIPERERYSGTDYHSPESAAANSRSYSTNKKQ